MQHSLRHEIVRAIFHAEPIEMSALEQPVETELTRAARGSISNAAEITNDALQFDEADFTKAKKTVKAKSNAKVRAKANKAERTRKAKARKRR